MTTVTGVLAGLARDPVGLLIRRWNWKAALFSAVIRASLFFAINQTAGLAAAARAMGAEFLFRASTAGFYGSVTQAFRRAEPAWAASLTVMVLMPVVAHSLELVVHLINGTPRLLPSIGASASLTVVSTLFNLFAMRRGLLVVGDDAGTIADDLRRLPAVIAAFAAAGPRAAWRLARSVAR